MTSRLAPLLPVREQLRFANRQYAAEWLAENSHPADPLDGTVDATQQYVDRITRSAWWARTCPPSWLGDQRDKAYIFDTTAPPQRILVTATRGTGGSTAPELVQHRGRWMPAIRLGTGERGADLAPKPPAIGDPWVILHEIAHVMAFSSDHSGHGREFARSMLLLTRRWIGPEAAQVLREAYAAEGVKYRAR